MCDTILASPESTAGATMLFGKNSDRQRNEAQAIEYFPERSYPPGAKVECTYVSVPQVTRTRAVLLSRPFWIWGAEMGANDRGVVIGNEGLHARSPAPEQESLIGMDLLRLALERADTAAEAVETITALLKQYGQGGNCGHTQPVYYNNGFMIADANEAFVLETIDREWLLERVRGVRAISNRYSIGRNPERTSDGLTDLVRNSGWSTEPGPDYAAVIANPNREHIGNAGARLACSTALLRARLGALTVSDMMSILRDHGSDQGSDHASAGEFHPQWRTECTTTRTVCMHAGAADRQGQTVGSMVSEVSRGGTAVHWVTGTSAACLSIFKPVLLDSALPDFGPAPADQFNADTLWWRHERLHRRVLQAGLGQFLEEIRPERDALEAQFRDRLSAVLKNGNAAEKARVVAQCWADAAQVEDRWYERVRAMKPAALTPSDAAWAEMNRLAGFEMQEA